MIKTTQKKGGRNKLTLDLTQQREMKKMVKKMAQRKEIEDKMAAENMG